MFYKHQKYMNLTAGCPSYSNLISRLLPSFCLFATPSVSFFPSVRPFQAFLPAADVSAHFPKPFPTFSIFHHCHSSSFFGFSCCFLCPSHSEVKGDTAYIFYHLFIFIFPSSNKMLPFLSSSKQFKQQGNQSNFGCYYPNLILYDLINQFIKQLILLPVSGEFDYVSKCFHKQDMISEVEHNQNQVSIFRILLITYPMQKLYAIAFQRILNRLATESIEPSTLNELLLRNGIRNVPDFVYHRIPREQFRNFVKTPCPVSGDSTLDQKSAAIIDASRRIRSSFAIDDKKVCSKCPLQGQCAHFSKPGSPDTPNSLPDILLYMESMKNKSLIVENQIEYKIWKAGYKSCDSILAVIQDLSQGGHQTFQFQKMRLEYIEQKKQQANFPQALEANVNIEGLVNVKIQQKRVKDRQPPKANRKQEKQEEDDDEGEQEEDEDEKEGEKTGGKEEKAGLKYRQIFEQQQQFLQKSQREKREEPTDRKNGNNYERRGGDFRENRRDYIREENTQGDFKRGYNRQNGMRQNRGGDFKREDRRGGDFNRERRSGDFNRERRGGDFNRERRGGDFNREDRRGGDLNRSQRRDRDFNREDRRGGDFNRERRNKSQDSASEFKRDYKNDRKPDSLRNEGGENKNRNWRQNGRDKKNDRNGDREFKTYDRPASSNNYDKNRSASSYEDKRSSSTIGNDNDRSEREFIDKKWNKAGDQYKPNAKPVYQNWQEEFSPADNTNKGRTLKGKQEAVVKDIEYVNEREERGDAEPRRGRKIRR